MPKTSVTLAAPVDLVDASRSSAYTPSDRRGAAGAAPGRTDDTMRLGYFMMPMHPLGSDPATTLEQDLQQVERLDRLGYGEVWVGEHFTTEWENIPAPDLFIAAALQRTQRIVFGTGVSCMPNHSPFVLAQRIAQL